MLSIGDSTTVSGYGVYSAMAATANTGYAIYATSTGRGYAPGRDRDVHIQRQGRDRYHATVGGA